MLPSLLDLRLLACLLFVGSALAQVDPYSREADPVVLKGEVLPNIMGQDPSRILAYRWTGSEFEQIPVQIDEMHVQMWDTIKNGDCL